MFRFEPWKAKGGDFQTNRWTTITVPLNQFKKSSESGQNGAGAPAATIKELIGNIDEVVKFMFVNDTETDLPVLDVGIDNIRVVRVRK